MHCAGWDRTRTGPKEGGGAPVGLLFRALHQHPPTAELDAKQPKAYPGRWGGSGFWGAFWRGVDSIIPKMPVK